MTACKSCGAPIVFATTFGGKAAPFQRDPAGEWAIDAAGNAKHVGKAAAQLEIGAAPVERYTSHFATCKQGRRRPDKREIAAKAALVCVDEGVTLRDAMARFGIGWVLLRTAIARLRRERAAAAARSAP